MCAYQFLPYNSSRIRIFDIKTVQADSILKSKQIDTLFINVGVRKGVLGGDHFGLEA